MIVKPIVKPIEHYTALVQGLTLCEGDRVSVDSSALRTLATWPSLASCSQGAITVRNPLTGRQLRVDSSRDEFHSSPGQPTIFSLNTVEDNLV